MPAIRQKYGFHLIAILTVIVWGTTFVSTKVLINHGLLPVEILIYRFALAYAGILFFCPRTIFAKNRKDELLCMAIGMCGGSLYFLFENTALQIAPASNVALIICITPILTTFLTRLVFKKERIISYMIWGSFIALSGVVLVVFNGKFILKISPLGDMFTLLAALSWAFYSIVFGELSKRYSTLFITRKVFFYGIVTVLPFLYFSPATFDFRLVASPVILFNLLFLGIVASLLCYITWNKAVKELGIVQTSNYLYLNPLVTLLTSSVVIHERITFIALIGSALILSGIYITGKKLRR
jgi:drug/metabolite transporter (DMT)-like permease